MNPIEVIEHPAQVLNRIGTWVHTTPVIQQASLNREVGCAVYLKAEHLQKVGAFKARGAVNALLQLPEETRSRGVATHSSGNHGQALAWAASMLGIPAWVVMPTNAPEIKRKAVLGYGAMVVPCEPNLAAREQTLNAVTAETGSSFIPPYDHPHIIAGQGTAAWELLQEHPEITDLIAPVGGGGLLSGTLMAALRHSSSVRVWGAEPAGADDAWHSLATHQRVPQTNPNTICDGLRTSLGELPFELLHGRVSGIVRVEDADTMAAMRWLFERTKAVVEPSGAIALAAVMANQAQWQGQKVGVILSGGNVDLAHLPF
jgi:threonine dehydratase